MVKEPADEGQRGSGASLRPIETNKPAKSSDKPTAAQSKLLAKPAVEIKYTGKDGKTPLSRYRLRTVITPMCA